MENRLKRSLEFFTRFGWERVVKDKKIFIRTTERKGEQVSISENAEFFDALEYCLSEQEKFVENCIKILTKT